jgi:hypothetical protein
MARKSENKEIVREEERKKAYRNHGENNESAEINIMSM